MVYEFDFVMSSIRKPDFPVAVLSEDDGKATSFFQSIYMLDSS